MSECNRYTVDTPGGLRTDGTLLTDVNLLLGFVIELSSIPIVERHTWFELKMALTHSSSTSQFVEGEAFA